MQEVISLFNQQAGIPNQQNLVAGTNQQAPKVNLDLKPDSVELNTKVDNKSKVGKYIAIGLAVTAAAIGTILLLTKGKTCLLELNAKKAQKYGEKIQEKAGKLQDEVVELFKNGGMEEGRKVAEIVEGNEEGIEIMKELASDGSILRSSKFIDKALDKVEVQTKKGMDVYEFFDGKLLEYQKGYEELEDGSQKAAKRLLFNDGKLTAYQKGYEELKDGSQKAAKILNFEDGKLAVYLKGYELSLEDESVKIAKGLEFDDGKLSRYQKGYELLEDGSEKFAKRVDFTDGILPKVERNIVEVEVADEIDDFADEIGEFDDGLLDDLADELP